MRNYPPGATAVESLDGRSAVLVGVSWQAPGTATVCGPREHVIADASGTPVSTIRECGYLRWRAPVPEVRASTPDGR